MEQARSTRKPAFIWQATMILLPVAVLSALGLVSLRQDQQLAEQEARELGTSSARRLAQVAGEEAAGELNRYRDARLQYHSLRAAALSLMEWGPGTAPVSARKRIDEWRRTHPGLDLATMPLCQFQADPAGENSLPGEYALVPQPPEWLAALDGEQGRLWRSAQQAEFVLDDQALAQSALERFLSNRPPAAAGANAEFLLWRLKSRELDSKETASQIASAPWARSGVLTEAGLPLGQVACYEALRRLPERSGLPDKLLQTVAQAINVRPSIFSPRLIAEAERVAGSDTASDQGVEALQAWWKSEERARQVLGDFREQHPAETWTNGLFWLDSLGEWFLVSVECAKPASHFTFYPEVLVVDAFTEAAAKSDVTVPRYAGATVNLAGRELALTTGPSVSGEPMPPLLGEARGFLTLAPRLPQTPPLPSSFRLSVYLTSPGLLYARQRERSLLFGLLVLCSAGAAFAGLLAAYRSFHRQLRLNEMKSNFVSSVSHELRAPIASVRLMAESLERGKIPEPARQHDYFRFIVQECRRLSSLIENVLDFSRIDQGRKQYEFEPTDLLALTKQTATLMETYAAERQVHLSLALEGGAGNCQLAADGKAVQQALINLIDNAIKHSPRGETVTVGLEANSPAAGLPARGPRAATHLRLWVEDRGPGIPAAEHEKIFERFYRLGSELRRETQGVGIGLSIVKHVVEAHGGRVLVRSAPGQGSRFTIELPLPDEGRDPEKGEPNSE